MANKQIIGFPLGTYNSALMIASQLSGGGAGSTKKIPITSLVQYENTITKYVSSVGGVDSPERGSPLAPYASLTYTLSQITDNSSTNPYLIKMFGIFSETDFHPKPYVYYDLQDSALTVTNQVTLDASFSPGGGQLIMQNCKNINFIGGLNFDLTGAGFSVIEMTNLRTASSGNWNILGNPSDTTIVIMDGIYGFSSIPNILIQDCYGAFSSGAPQSLTVRATSTTIQYSFESGNNTILGDFVMEAQAGAIINVESYSNKIYGDYRAKTTLTGAVSVQNTSAEIPNSLTIDGLNILFNTDVLDIVPTFTNGATQASIIYASRADSLNANYTSINYMTTDEMVRAHLVGIDNKLGNILSAGYLTSANDLSDVSSDSTSRTNLGLGTISTQNANNVNISGGDINSTVIGATTPARVSSSQFNVVSTTSGSRGWPLMTTIQRTSIISPGINEGVFDTDLHQGMVWDGSSWRVAY